MKPTTLFPHLVLLFLISTNFCLSQTQEIDSLQNLLKAATDTTEINLLRTLGRKFRSHDKERALDYYTQSLEKSKQLEFVQGEIEGLYAIGVTHGMGGNYTESLDYLNRCLVLAAKHQDFIRVNQIYNSKGIVYKRIGDYPTSQSFYLKRLKLIDSLQLDQDTSVTYINLGILYDLMNQQDKAIESYEKALEIYTGPDRESMENTVLVNLAVIDYNNGDYEAALDKFLKRQVYAQRQNDNIALCSGYANIASCYLHLEQWALAHDYLTKSLKLAEKLSLKRQIATAYYGLADLMFQQKRYNEAINYSNSNLQTLNSMGGYDQKREAHEMAYEINEAVGQLPKAIYHLNQTMAYRDSLLNETKIREIQNLQIQHDVYTKDKEIKENELQLALLNTRVTLNNRRIIYLSIIIALLLFSAGLLYVRFQSKKKSNAILFEKNKLISQQKEVIEAMNVQLEKRMLRAQMNPHFIFNSLSSIQHLISSDDKVSALKYLSKFSKLLRQVLETSINISLVLYEEIELLKIYVELESLRFDNSFAYTFHVDEKLDVYQYEIPMLLVQPYIENAIIHGLMPKEGVKKLYISFMEKDDFIACIIEDNGVGINPETKTKKSKRPSRGMSITAQRIQALKKISNQDLIKVENIAHGTTTGTKVTILIPKD